jgi:predicted HTH domain antitoxin
MVQGPTRQDQAILAYRDGSISIGKLAEVMGMNVMSLRVWMNEHGIPQNTCYDEEDAANA